MQLTQGTAQAKRALNGLCRKLLAHEREER